MKNAPLPYHIYVNIENSFLGPNMPKGTTRGLWHGVYARPGQLLMAHVMLESGAHWSELPLHAMSLGDRFPRGPKELMPWHSMGSCIEPVAFPYLEGLSCEVKSPFEEKGRHTGIVIDWADGYSMYPEEHKPLNLIALESGQFALMPNNFVHFRDGHFVNEDAKQNMRHYRRGEQVYWE